MRRILAVEPPKSPIVTSAKSIGDFVRAARTAEGMSQEDAAAISGVSKKTVVNLEAGQETVGIGLVLRILADHGLTLFIAEKQHAARVSMAIAASIEAGMLDEPHEDRP